MWRQIGVLLIIVGLVLTIGAYSDSSLAIINVGTTSLTGSLSPYSDYPSSTSSSNPTMLAYTGSVVSVSMTFYENSVAYESGYTVNSHSGTLMINGASVTPTVITYGYVQTGSYYYPDVYIDYAYTPTSFNSLITFDWTGSISVTGTPSTSSSSATTVYTGSATTYAEFTQTITNIGEFYVSAYSPASSGISATSYGLTYITNTSTITYNFNSFPAYLNVSYVENNGVTSNLAYVYITVNGVTYNLSKNAQTTILGYTAWTQQVKITSAGTYTVYGYVVGNSVVNGKSIELMSIIGNFPSLNNTGTLKSLTYAQMETMALGIIITLIGAVFIIRRH